MNKFPNGKRFAFSVFDDTDGGTVSNLRPVYELLDELGIYVTKSVWPLSTAPGVRSFGASLEDHNYLQFVLWLRSRGFEIALHNVRHCDADREVIVRGLERFRELIGEYPRLHTNHMFNRDNVFWGATRFKSRLIRLLYAVATRFRHHHRYSGHVEGSSYFWGDLLREHIHYVRNLTFDEINLDKINPSMPYFDPSKPFVRHWFSSSEGRNAGRFCKMLCEDNQDRLEEEGGVCIMYSHFAAGFCDNGKLHPYFEQLMRRLAKKQGWFVPVGTLLDHLRETRGDRPIPKRELAALEARWLLSHLRRTSK